MKQTGKTTSAMPCPSIRDKVDFLRRPQAWPDHPATVEVIETHMSWVFLTETEVYKLKKPVRYAFLDFGSLPARQHCCEEEVRLNRRLAAPVYRGTLALNWREEGLHIGGGGRCVDWLVHMRRLPSTNMLDQLLHQRTVPAADLRPLASLLASFHRHAIPRPMAPPAYLGRFAEAVAHNASELRRRKFGLPPGAIDKAIAAQQRFLRLHGDLLAARAGQLVDAHGDLRPEHVYLGDPPMVIDCLEFNPELRRLDPVDELASLAMDCARLGGDFAEVLLRAREAAGGERPPAELWTFYWRYRATLRARLAIWHLEERNIPDPGKWRERALAYLALANGTAPAAALAPR